MKKTGLVILSFILSSCIETETGDKIGVVTKCAWEGVIFKTYECELIRGGMNDGSGSFGKSFHFTVEKKELIDDLQKIFSNQKMIKIRYHKEAFTFLRSEGESDNNFLDEITIIKNDLHCLEDKK